MREVLLSKIVLPLPPTVFLPSAAQIKRGGAGGRNTLHCPYQCMTAMPSRYSVSGILGFLKRKNTRIMYEKYSQLKKNS